MKKKKAVADFQNCKVQILQKNQTSKIKGGTGGDYDSDNADDTPEDTHN